MSFSNAQFSLPVSCNFAIASNIFAWNFHILFYCGDGVYCTNVMVKDHTEFEIMKDKKVKLEKRKGYKSLFVD